MPLETEMDKLYADKKQFLEIEKLGKFGVRGYFLHLKIIVVYILFGMMIGGLVAFLSAIFPEIFTTRSFHDVFVEWFSEKTWIIVALFLKATETLIFLGIFALALMFWKGIPILKKNYNIVKNSFLGFSSLEYWMFFWMGCLAPVVIQDPQSHFLLFTHTNTFFTISLQNIIRLFAEGMLMITAIVALGIRILVYYGGFFRTVHTFWIKRKWVSKNNWKDLLFSILIGIIPIMFLVLFFLKIKDIRSLYFAAILSILFFQGFFTLVLLQRLSIVLAQKRVVAGVGVGVVGVVAVVGVGVVAGVVAVGVVAGAGAVSVVGVGVVAGVVFALALVWLILLHCFFIQAKKDSSFISDTPLESLDDLHDIQQSASPKNSAVFQSLEKKIESFSMRLLHFPPVELQKGSYVFAINALWGNGKTSFLSMVRNEVAFTTPVWYKNPIAWWLYKDFDEPFHNPEYIWIDYNPWHFDTTEGLIRDFFATLDQKIFERTGRTHKKQFQKYAKMLSGVEASFSDGIKVSFSGGNSESLQETKKELEKFLQTLSETIVITLDDIDRMEADEIMTILKLVKLLSDFPRIIFVLLLDKKRVSEIIIAKHGEQYENYLQKIINSEISLDAFTPGEYTTILHYSLSKLYNKIDLKTVNNIYDSYHRLVVEKIWKIKYEEILDAKSAYMSSSDAVEYADFSKKEYFPIVTPRDIKQLCRVIGDLLYGKSDDDKKIVLKEISSQFSSAGMVVGTAISSLVESQVFVIRKS